MGTWLPIVILTLFIVFFIVYKKNKKKKQLSRTASIRKEKDEVWNTIKMYIRDHEHDYKGEISDSYVVKRNPVDYVSPNISTLAKKQKRAEIDIRRMLQGKNREYSRPRDLYVVCYQTKNLKTNKFNPPKAFECEIVSERISKKETKQKIIITKTLDFDTEMEWIAPIRSIEQKKKEHATKVLAKQQAKNLAKQAKKKSKTKKD